MIDDLQQHDPADAHACAMRRWRQELSELGGPNNLLWFEPGSDGVLDLTTAHPMGVATFFSSGQVRLSQLFRESYTYAEASRRLRRILTKTVELQEDRGLDACWMGIGLARWATTSGQRRPCAPVLLRRIQLRSVPGHPDDLTVALDSDAVINPMLIAYLMTENGIDLDVDALTALARAATPSDPRQVFDELVRNCSHHPAGVQLQVERRFLVSTFHLSKADLVADFMGESAALPPHPIVAALTGDAQAMHQVSAVPPVPDAAGIADALGVLPSDSSQEAVVAAVCAGAHVAVEGAPGTGKTQTIANLVAALAAQGRPVLLVSNKTAAIDAVRHRLDEVGLGDLVTHMSDGRPGPEFEEYFNRRIQEAIAASEPIGDDLPPSATATALQAHHEALHTLHGPWQVSLAEVLERVTELGEQRPAPRSHARLSATDLLTLTPEQRDDAAGRLLDVARKGAWPTSGENDPWYGASLVGTQQAQRAADSVAGLAGGRLAEHRARIEELFDQIGLPTPADMREEEESLELLQQVSATLEVFRPEVFEAPLGDLAAATGNREFRRQADASLGVVQRRRLAAQAQELLRPGPRPDLHGVLVRADHQRTQWRRIAGKGSRPATVDGLAGIVTAHERMRDELEWLGNRLATTRDGGDLLDQSFDHLQARLGRLVVADDRREVVPTVAADLDRLRAQGFGPLVDDLAERQVPADQVTAELEFVWWTSLYIELKQRSHSVALSGVTMAQMLQEYADDEDARRRARIARVKAQVDSRLEQVVRALPQQVRDVQQGLARGAALRDLLPIAPELLMALMPCWAMSPLLVPAHVPPGVWFDVALLDEASRLTLAQAVPSIRRSAQVALFGDSHQLLPRSFSVDAGGPAGDTVEDESALSQVAPLVPAFGLSTHYRSSDARLFAFANAQAYHGRIRSFPGTAVERPVRLDVVSADGGAAAEIDRVVEVVATHARHGHGSLMVVTLTDEHAHRIASRLATQARREPEVAQLLAGQGPEPFLVRTAERAQGVSRDVVVFTGGARISSEGSLVGAVASALSAKGERLLLVATTRARTQLIVVSSVRSGQLAAATLRSRGAQMYRDLLVFAAAGGARNDGSPQEEAQAPSVRGVRRRRVASTGSVLDRPATPLMPTTDEPVIADLVRRLRHGGLDVRPAEGVAVPSLDLVVEHPEQSGTRPTAIDTDGVALREMFNVRDRDLVRPEQLRARGWRYQRVLLSEVFRDPAREVARLLELAESGTATADLAGDSATDTIVPESSVTDHE